MPTSLTHTISWAETAALNPRTPICLSCGAELAPTLAWLASLRCHDCRDSHAPIDARYVHSATPGQGNLAAARAAA